MPDRYLDLLRHGEVEGRTCFRGSQDDPLSPLGWEQMADATRERAGWTQVLSSPSQRCRAFAQALAERLAVPLRIEEAARERDFGAWEGLGSEAIPADDLQRFAEDPIGYTPPGAEPYAAFRDRVHGLWQQLREDSAQHALLVTHGGVIRVLVAATLEMPDRALLLLEVGYANLTRIRLNRPPWAPSLVFHRGSE